MEDKKINPFVLGSLLVILSSSTLCHGLIAWEIKGPIDVIAIGFLIFCIILGVIVISLAKYGNI